MYARDVGDRVLTFGVSGMLFRDGLVMYDRQTDTLWTQVDGRAVRGPLRGAALRIVASVHATWAEWKQLYPESLVLKKQAVARSPYAAYNRDRGRLGILGRPLRDRRLPGKERVLGVRTADAATAFVERDVRAAGLAQADVGSLPVVVAAPAPGLPIVAFDRRVPGRTLTFAVAPGDSKALVDRETGSRWSLADGRATSGPLAGARLSRAPAYPAFWFGWQSYFPWTQVWTRE